MPTVRPIILALALALPLGVAATDEAAASQQLRIAVEHILLEYNFDVDVSTLSDGQVAAIYATAYGNRSWGDRRALIKSQLRGGLLRNLR